MAQAADAIPIRLPENVERVRDLMQDGVWRTLLEISMLTEMPTQSASARLRDLRKEHFGAHIVDRRYAGSGIFEYRLQLRKDDRQ